MFPWSYKEAGILGINGRNRDYIIPNNPRHLYPLVDDKIETKRLAIAAGIQTPEMYGIIDNLYDINKLRGLVEGKGSFVVKPARGSGGGGITLIAGLTPTGYRKMNGTLMSESEMRYYLSNIISGMYAMTGNSDRVILEYTVKFDPMFADIAYQGVPDIRVVLYKGVPAMAMLRLPTFSSRGKANLHQGGIGVGVRLDSGRTFKAFLKGNFIEAHPDTGAPLTGVQLPFWSDLISIATRLGKNSPLQYIGVDLTIDAKKGPLVLEFNARPGLEIQNANREGLQVLIARAGGGR